MTTGERVREVRKSTGLSLEKFGERIGLKNAAVSLIENNRRALTDTVAKAIAREFSVSEEWLKTGTGPMRTITAEGMVAEVAEMFHLSEWGTKTLERFLRLDPEDQRELLRLLEALFDPPGEDEDEIEAIVRAAAEEAAEAKRAELRDEKRDMDA